jgi:methylated-DNA-protein-cysteine methyltransferase related protein
VNSFEQSVLTIVASIPGGKVTTYGRISEAIGCPRRARHVGLALARAPESGDYPCHRVVNRDGYLSGGWAFGHPEVMRDLLEEEGVPFAAEWRVDLDECLWEPFSLTQPDPLHQAASVRRAPGPGGAESMR